MDCLYLFLFSLSLFPIHWLRSYEQSAPVLFDVCLFPRFCVQNGKKWIVYISMYHFLFSLSLFPFYWLRSYEQFVPALFKVCLFQHFCVQNGTKWIVTKAHDVLIYALRTYNRN